MSMAHSECQKYFLQAIMQKGAVTKLEFQLLLKKCCEATDEDYRSVDAQSFVSSINKQIQSVHLEIRKGQKEDDGSEIYALITTTDQEINQLAVGGDFSKGEIEIFRRTVDLIVSSSTGMVSSTEILNLTDELSQRNISKSDAEVLITNLVKQQWLDEKDGIVFLAPRTVLELEPYIKSDLKEFIIYCGICKSMVFRGITCPSCSGKIHHYCASTYFRGRSQSDCKCPTCHGPMPTTSLSPVSPTESVNGELNGTNDSHSASVMERRKRRR